jgi:hypothetical protein
MSSARASLSAGSSCNDASSFLAFLASAKEAVAGFTAPAPTPAAYDRAGPLLPHVYFGNEAGDADSLVSPLCYAYLQAELAARGRPSEEGSGSFAAYAHVPLLSISRADLALRPEVRRLPGAREHHLV